MDYRLEFSADAERDLELIFDHLFDSYRSLGEALEDALDHAAARTMAVHTGANRILTAPHRGESHDDILPGLRHLTIDRAIYWFDVDEGRRTVRILAVFFAGQDHVRRMLRRLLADESP